jgi:hypothetical protein
MTSRRIAGNGKRAKAIGGERAEHRAGRRESPVTSRKVLRK